MFKAVIQEYPQEARVFVPGKPFQPSLMFASKAGANQVKPRLGAPLWDRHLA
jgi:hypothetical protein